MVGCSQGMQDNCSEIVAQVVITLVVACRVGRPTRKADKSSYHAKKREAGGGH